MFIILLGPPGAGKGTQADLLADKLAIPKVSTGDILRRVINNQDSQAEKYKKIIEQGRLLPDEVILSFMKTRLELADCAKGCLLDGFPRTLEQARALPGLGIKIDAVCVLDIDDAKILSRLTGRRVHPASGRTYHIDSNPPKTAGIDDLTGDLLVQRDDDSEDTIKNRLHLYRQQTYPLVDWYKQQATQDNLLKYFSVDADKPLDVLHTEILAKLQ